MAKILKARKSTIALVTLGLLATSVAVAEANGVWKEPNYQKVSNQYSIVKFCDGHNLIYASSAESYGHYPNYQFQAFRNATECGGNN